MYRNGFYSEIIDRVCACVCPCVCVSSRWRLALWAPTTSGTWPLSWSTLSPCPPCTTRANRNPSPMASRPVRFCQCFDGVQAERGSRSVEISRSIANAISNLILPMNCESLLTIPGERGMRSWPRRRRTQTRGIQMESFDEQFVKAISERVEKTIYRSKIPHSRSRQ